MKVKLSDAFDLQMGKTPPRNDRDCWGEGHKWISISDIGNAEKYIDTTKEEITDVGISKSGIKVVPKGTVIMSFKLSIGKTAITAEDMYTNEAIMAFINKGKYEIDTNYLYHMCKGIDWFEGTNKAVLGLTLNKATMSEKTIEIPTIEVQQEVVSVLDKMDELISLRKEQLAKLDRLVKSRFIELFGDYRINEKGFDCKKGSELFKFSSGKFLPEEKRLDEGIPVYGGNGIAWYTSESLVDYPTIIIGRVGAQCGNIHAVTTPVWITDNAIYIKEQKTNAYTLEFLTELMRMMDFYQYADFSGQPKITQKPLETLNYIMPPIELQNEYTAFVEQTDKSKLAIQQSLDKLELLKKSLMQKYFG